MSDLLNDMNSGIVPFTRIPNYFFDDYYFLLSESALKVYMAIARKTIGWRKNRDCISYSQLKSLSRLSETSISKGIKELIKNDLIEILKEGRGKGEKIYYGLLDKSSDKKERVNAPKFSSARSSNTPDFEVNCEFNAPKFGDTKRNINIKKEEVKKRGAQLSNVPNNKQYSEIFDNLLTYGLSDKQAKGILNNYSAEFILEKIEQFKYLLKSKQKKIKGEGRYLYNSIVNDWKDNEYAEYKAKIRFKSKVVDQSDDSVAHTKNDEKLRQEYDAYLEKLSADYLDNILPNELKEIDMVLESDMASDFYKMYEKGSKIYNNLLNIKRIEYIKRKRIKPSVFEEYVAQKKKRLAA